MAPEFPEQFDYLPLIPEPVLRKHQVHQPHDSRFRASARLLQALWRTDKQLPAGTYISSEGKAVRLGSRLSSAAARTGANFISRDIAALAFKEVCYREIGAAIDEERLYCNLLSSTPLVFNLIGPMRLDLELATAVMRKIIPGFMGTITQVIFEHSPARRDPRFTHDGTAFDAVMRYTTDAGRRGFIAVEVKYSESCTEPVPTLRPRYDELSRETGLFVDADNAELRTNPLQQLWREHCLAQIMIQNGLYDEGYFVLIAPRLNHLVQSAANGYVRQLKEPVAGLVPFINVTLETVIEAMKEAGATSEASTLYRRYCDFWLVDGEIELALSGTFKPKRTSEKQAAPSKKTRKSHQAA
ncbi:PGN_0703 family putative restriction endonuclease [Methyloferula stellata]|uniref:PGN_0703 family putative restriction endonuclease n=1 Tax=Methyloferula stellata TaxID=876270 RepID=UPI0003786941|nr:hypothetical protein [Methyloferula stellata]